MRVEYAFSLDVIDLIASASWPDAASLASVLTSSERIEALGELVSTNEVSARAYDRMYRRYVGREINVGLLIDLHRLGMPVGGGFRREEISVGKDDLENGFLATALNVRPFMGQLVNRINLMPAAPARVIAFAYAFLILHPFNDGNGRVFRMMCPILGARSQAPLWFGFSRSSKKEVGKFKRCMTHLSVGACEPMKEFLHMCIDACQRKGV